MTDPYVQFIQTANIEPMLQLVKDTDVYQDPLGRLVIYAQGARGVNLNTIGPGRAS